MGLLNKVVKKAVKQAEEVASEDLQRKADDIIRVNTPGFWIGLGVGAIGTGILCVIFRRPTIIVRYII